MDKITDEQALDAFNILRNYCNQKEGCQTDKCIFYQGRYDPEFPCALSEQRKLPMEWSRKNVER